MDVSSAGLIGADLKIMVTPLLKKLNDVRRTVRKGALLKRSSLLPLVQRTSQCSSARKLVTGRATPECCGQTVPGRAYASRVDGTGLGLLVFRVSHRP